MPINTAKCPHCGARVNHIVKSNASLSGNEQYEVDCPRCKQPFTVAGSELSERTREDVRELNAFEQLMNESESNFVKALADDEGDSVEKALERADEVFNGARRALDDISLDAASEVIDADQLLETYSIPDVKSFAMNRADRFARKAQDRFDLSDEVTSAISGLAEAAYDQASDSAAEKVAAKVGALREAVASRIPEIGQD